MVGRAARAAVNGMRRGRYIPAALVIALVSACARAGLSPSCARSVSARSSLALHVGSGDRSCPPDGDWSHGDSLASRAGFSSFSRSSEPPTRHTSAVRSLPADAGSSSLLLCGLASLAVFQVGRSARRVHFGDVPAWLHTGGPAQIGHAVVFHPLLSSVLPGRQPEQPFAERMRLLCCSHLRPDFRLRSQCLVTAQRPRAPPYHS